jgi:hypothetical protein
LGDGMVASGLLSPDVLVKALDVARRGGSLLGTYLVASGLVKAEALRLALFAQIPRKLERLVNLPPDTDYAFYGGINLIPDWANGELFPCHPLTAILAAVRKWHDRARLRATLGRIAKQALSFHPEVDLSAFILTGDEQTVIEAIQSRSPTLSSLYDLRLANEDVVSSLVYTLAVTRSFAFTAVKGPPMVALPALEEVTDDLGEDAIAISTTDAPPPGESAQPADHYGASMGTMPMVPTTAMPVIMAPSPQAIPVPPGVAAPRQTAPDVRAPSGVWRPAKVPAAQVVAPAAAVAAYSASGEEGGVTTVGPPPSMLHRESQIRKAPPRAQQVTDENSDLLVQAMTDFRLAEAALERNEIAQADELARRALAAEPSNPDYAAMVAWTSALAGAKDAIPLAIAKLNVILKEDATCARALLYRGRLYKRAKRSAEALRDFSAVLDQNPKHAEAATEVRLLKLKKK